MKMKLNVYITNAEAFAKNPLADCYSVSTGTHMDDYEGWVNVGSVSIDINVDRQDIVQEAQKTLDAEIGKCQQGIDCLKNRKAELLALPAPTTGANENDS